MLIDKAFETVGLTKAMEITLYIIQHTDAKTKIFCRTYKEIQKETGASERTIADTLKYLASKGALEHLGGSRWVNNMVEGYSRTCNGDELYVRNKGA